MICLVCNQDMSANADLITPLICEHCARWMALPAEYIAPVEASRPELRLPR